MLAHYQSGFSPDGGLGQKSDALCYGIGIGQNSIANSCERKERVDCLNTSRGAICFVQSLPQPSVQYLPSGVGMTFG